MAPNCPSPTSRLRGKDFIVIKRFLVNLKMFLNIILYINQWKVWICDPFVKQSTYLEFQKAIIIVSKVKLKKIFWARNYHKGKRGKSPLSFFENRKKLTCFSQKRALNLEKCSLFFRAFWTKNSNFFLWDLSFVCHTWNVYVNRDFVSECQATMQFVSCLIVYLINSLDGFYWKHFKLNK